MQIVRGEDTYETLRGWNLGFLPPDKRRRIVFLPGKARCIVCHQSISDREWRLFQTCSSWTCRAQQRSKQRALRKKIDESELRHRREFERRVNLLRDKAAGLLGIDNPKSYQPVVIPGTQNPITFTSEERRELLRDHLIKIISEMQENCEAIATDQEDSTKQAAVFNAAFSPHPIIREACAMCRGRCCINGKDHAYLSSKTIYRYVNRFPQIGNQGLCANLVSYIADHTVDNSCIYHGEMGCNLPRDARSNTCNEFECTGLRQLHQKISGMESHRIFLVAAVKSRAIRYAFMHG